MISNATLLDWMKADAADTATLRLLEQAAIKAVQKQTGRYFGVTATQTDIIRFRGWPLTLLNDPIGGAITSLSQWAGSAWQLVAATDYYVDCSFIWPNASLQWPPIYQNPQLVPRFKAIYSAGYTVDVGDANVWPAPEDIQQAVKLLVGHWFENRESVVVGTSSAEVQQSLDWLLEGHRRATV